MNFHQLTLLEHIISHYGNENEDGSLDDTTKNDNRDRNKILATVVYAVYIFTSEYPSQWIFFSGSTPERTRLYRMAISLNLEELSNDFDVIAIQKNMENFSYAPFKKDIDCFGFLVRKKVSNFTV